MKKTNSLTMALCLVFLTTLSINAHAIPVGYFSDGAFGDTGREVVNMRADLVMLGHTVTDFSGSGDAAWTAAIAGASALVIPELERGDLAAALSATAEAAIASFVNGGGILVIAGDGSNNALGLLNSIFGYALTQSTFTAGGTTNLGPDAAGTAYAGGPDPLGNLDGTLLVNTASLPGGALNLYSDAGATSVMQIGVGSGHVALLGFDWFEEDDASGLADWQSVLDSALTAASTPVPEPTSLALMLLGLGAIRARRRN